MEIGSHPENEAEGCSGFDNIGTKLRHAV